ncbi:hypothetical protein NDU88_008517 [Pleurodeles waltl]|uniref:Uncharacterized protein n=1 Tax=Pleurodeles waltl TaxID=8319 RepID=A0AAV7PPD1_PLEWA|nr:hypothetical protein NDU88_008517 [Pleurodeles waltl]
MAASHASSPSTEALKFFLTGSALHWKQAYPYRVLQPIQHRVQAWIGPDATRRQRTHVLVGDQLGIGPQWGHSQDIWQASDKVRVVSGPALRSSDLPVCQRPRLPKIKKKRIQASDKVRVVSGPALRSSDLPVCQRPRLPKIKKKRIQVE